MKKSLAILLAALMLLPLVGCASGKTDPEDTTAGTTPAVTDPAETTAPVEQIDPADVDNLPELDFDGAAFGMYTRTMGFFHGELTVEEATGDQLNDALYDRQTAVEERLNLKIEETTGSNTDAARNAIQAGDESYKLVNARNVLTVQYASSGLGYLLKDVKYIDLAKNYWYDSINENLTLAHKTFTAAGAYNLSSFDFTHVLLFNKQMIDDLSLENPYELVRNGQWTWDKFEEFGVKATSDLDGDGTMTKADRYGFVSATKQIPPCFLEGAGVLMLSKNPETDTPVFDLASDERFTTLFTELFELFYDTGLWSVSVSDLNSQDPSAELFSQDQALMMNSTFFYVQGLREMNADFGVLPYPKYDEEQKEYLSRIEGCELPLIPVCLSQADADMAGAFLEAMASYSHKHTIPVYYEIYLKTKLSRDSESAEMFDLIFANRIFDLGDTVWCDNIRDGFIRSLFNGNSRGAIVSTLKKSTNSVQKAIDSIVNGFE